LAEAVAATSFAIEGIAGDIARKVPAGFQYYRHEPEVDLSPKTYRWMRQHAQYDDEHPKIALEIVERYATTDDLRMRSMVAAKRSLELLDHALLTAYRAYSQPLSGTFQTLERRISDMPISFPERRFRRGPNAHSEQQPLDHAVMAVH
jgi:pyrroloquinoline quinone (PQQ) biosynthesis protein C